MSTNDTVRRPPTARSRVLRMCARQSMRLAGRDAFFDGWVMFGYRSKSESRAAAKLASEGRLERTKASEVFPSIGCGWAYRIPPNPTQAARDGSIAEAVEP